MTQTATADPAPSRMPFILLPGQAERRWMGRTMTDFLVPEAAPAAGFCLVDERAVQNETVPLHRHAEDEESFYVLEGTVLFALGDAAPVAASPGSFVHVPAGEVHGFRVQSATARYLILTTPQHGAFYRAITDAARADGSAPGTTVGSDRIMAACRTYGIEFVAPFPD